MKTPFPVKVSKYPAAPEDIGRVHLFLGLVFFCLAVMHYPHHASTLWLYRLGTFLGIAEPWMADMAAGSIFTVLAGISFYRRSRK